MNTKGAVSMSLLFKKCTCLVLALVMLLGMAPVTVFAEEPDPVLPEIGLENSAPSQIPEETAPQPEPSPEETAAPEEAPEAPEEAPEVPEEAPEPPAAEPFSMEADAPEGEPVFDSQNLTKLEIQTLPGRRFYQVGETPDLTGISVYAEDCIGLFQILSAEDLTLVSGDTSAAGCRTVTLGFGNLEVSYDIFVHTQCSYGDVLQDSAGYPESPHNYSNSTEETYSYQVPGAQYLTLLFSSGTYFESGYDYLTIFDGAGNQLGRYTGNALAGTTVTVPGDSVALFLDTDGSTTKYGFSLDSITAYVPVPVHESADAGVYTAPLCFVDGYTTHTCWICGEAFVQPHEGSAGHSFADGVCGICGLPEVHTASGMLSDTLIWAITEDNTLFIAGSGDMPEGITWPEEAKAATALTVGQGITSLSSQAFYGLTGLRSVKLPDTLVSIGAKAFRNCTGLTTLYIPAGVSRIHAGSYSNSPFYGCDSKLVIYCGADRKQEGWEDYWNYRGSGSPLTTNYGFTPEDYAYWTGFDNTAETVQIREGITAIPSKAFYDCKNLTEVILPESLKTIGEYAFYGCKNLTQIQIPDSVVSIGRYALANCSNLEGLTLPSGLETLGVRFLSGASKVKKITFPAALTHYGYDSGDGVLTGSYVETVAFDQGVTVIPDYALCGGSRVTDVTMPDTVTTIGSYAFSQCGNLKTLRLSEGLTAIGSYAFQKCSALTQAEIPQGVAVIEPYTFYQCSKLSQLTLPASLTAIGEYAFYKCGSLTSLSLPDSVALIGDYAFADCAKMALSGLPAGLTQVGKYAFSKCAGLTAEAFPGSLTHIGEYAFNGCSGLTAANLSSGLVSIGNYAFNGCSALASVTLPGTLTELGYSAFYGCFALTELRLPASLTTLGRNGSRGPLDGSGITKVIFADGFTAIPDYALSNNTSGTGNTYSSRIKEVVFEAPEKITAIGTNAFYNCAALEHLLLPSGITVIPERAFNGCKSLISVTLPENLTTISKEAFYGCAALESIAVPAGVTHIGEYAFRDCVALTKATLPEGLQSLGYSAFYGCFALTELRLPASLTTLGHNSSRGPLDGSGITKVIFADGFTAIPAYALSNYANGTGNTYSSRIKEVVFEAPEKITSIGTNAFYNCAALESLTLPSGITVIPERAFTGCVSLTSLTLPENLTTLSEEAFYGCSALASLEVPASVTAIGNYAFRDCGMLTEVTLPEGLQSLGYSAFYGCFALTELRLPASLTTLGRSGNRGPLDGSGITKVIFADGFTSVPAYALSSNASGISHTYASRIREVVFEAPDKITAIGANAFCNCLALESIAIPEPVVTLSEEAFAGCQSLSRVEWNSNLETIGEYAFQNCKLLSQAILPDSVRDIGRYAFSSCSALENLVIPAGAEVRSYAFRDCSGLKTLTIGDNAHIYGQAFSGCSNITAIHMGKDVVLEKNAFYQVSMSGECGEAMSWSLDIGTGTMSLTGSGEMTDYTPESPAPWSGFASMIRFVEFGNSVSDIGSYAFAGCTGLEGLVLPDSIRTLSENSFHGCENLVYLELPDGIQHIGKDAFADCAGLQEVIFLGDAPVMEDNCFGSAAATVRYPETASGFISRIFEKFIYYIWTKWDDTVPTKDVVILLDTSGSMDGKEATLSSASSQLIKSIGGAIKKTRIAVVEYDSGTNVLSDFTSNVYHLSNCVASLEADGGTEYRTALNKANTMITGRNSDIKFVIMFSDGEPNDNKNNIYTLANTMREQGIILYTVGLLSSSSQRQVLINVAGSESRYFEATNIAGLIAAFEELSRNFGKSEYSTVEMKINDERHDIFSEPYTLCLTSEIPISFYFTPGTNEMYNNVSGIAIEQDGRYVLSNTTGIFENIIPGNYFQSGKPIYMVMLDAGGNVIERKELLLNFTDSFSLTYVLGPDMNNAVYLKEDFVPGNEISKPADPSRLGYLFKGWYASENCEGTEFFSKLNYHNRTTLDQDLTLYAKWEEDLATLTVGLDTWSFVNFSTSRFPITDADYTTLISGISESDADDVRAYRDRGGAFCFGMSSSALLANENTIEVADFDARYADVADASSSSAAIMSMISYYHLRQKIGSIRDIRTSFNQQNDSQNIKSIVDKLQQTGEPVVIGFTFDAFSGGHAVVGYDLKPTADGYEFQVYDCSLENNPYTVTVAVTNNTYTATSSAWEQDWESGFFFKYGLTAAELKSLPILVAPQRTVRTGSSAGSAFCYELTTNYEDFTITDGTYSAVISGGELVSGDLNVECFGYIHDIGSEPELLFKLPMLAGDKQYTITQTSGGMLNTALRNRDPENGFKVSVTSEGSGVIVIGADRTVTTQFAQEMNHTVSLTLNNPQTDWYTTEITGSSTGLTLTAASGNVEIVSQAEATVNVEVISGINNMVIESIPVDSVAVEIQESENRDCVLVKDTDILYSSAYGYSVVFDSQYGTTVESLLNVPHGSVIEEPTDPTKAGYIFQGWYTDEEYTDLWDFTTDTITADTVLYAGWSINPNYLQTVTFRVPGREDQIVYIPKGDVIPADYAPLGDEGEPLVWYTNAAYTSAEWNFETDTVSGDTVLYGKTTLCTVSYVTGTEQALESSKLYSGMKIPRPTGLVLEGSTLCGWYTDEALTREWIFETDLLAEDVTLYAKWLPNELDKQGNDTGICIEILLEDSYVYTGKAIKPEILVRDAGRILTPGVDYTVTYKNNTNARSKDDPSVKESKLPQIIIQGKGNYKSAKKITAFFTIHRAHMQDLQVTLPGALACKSGNKLQTLKPTVSTGLVKVASSAYTLRYYTDAQLTQAVKGITGPGRYYVVLEAKQDKAGNYSGNLQGMTDPIAVEAAPATQLLSSAKITLPKTVSAVSQQPEAMDAIPALIAKVTVNKTDYLTDEANLETFLQLFTVTAQDTDGTKVSQEDLGRILTGAGKKTLIIAARAGNPLGLVGEKTASVTVKGAALKKNQFRVTFDQTGNATVTKAPYTGLAQTPTVISSLTAGRDYTVSFKSGKTVLDSWQVKNAGSYSLVITGKGAYSGSLSFNFSITKVDIAKAYAAGNIRITSAGQAVYAPTGAKLTLSAAYLNDRGSRISMAEGTDYTLSYSGNKTVTESASMTLKGKGNFSGTLTKKAAPELIFSVTPKDLAAGDISVTVNGLTVKKGQITGAKYTVLHAGKTVSTGQYTGQLTDNGDETLTLTITGKGKLYTGSRSLLVRTNLIKATDTKQVKVTLPKENRYYTGSQICPQVTITDAQGNDISHCFSITYGENTKVGSGSVTVTGLADQGYYGTKTLKFTILPKWTQWLFG